MTGYAKKIKVLILFQDGDMLELMNSLCHYLGKEDVVAVTFDISEWKSNKKGFELPFFLRVAKRIIFNKRMKLYFFMLCPKLFLRNLKREADIIDIHFFGSFYFKAFNYFIKSSSRYKITLWGSDFYRASASRREKQRYYYEMADCIQIGTEQMKNDFLDYYKQFEKKIRIAHFGSYKFDIIDKIREGFSKIELKKQIGIPAEKIIICCGTNGGYFQRHIEALEALEHLPADIKGKIYLLIPMNYGGTVKYIGTVQKKLRDMGIEYKIITARMSDEEICKIRLTTDILITIQVSDAFSGAVQEHIYSGSILVAGEWLPYKILNENNIFYLQSSVQGLSDIIKSCIVNYNEYIKLAENNSDKMRSLSSWDNTIKSWKNIYKEMVND